MTLKGIGGVYKLEFDTFTCQGSHVLWGDIDYDYTSSEYLLEREYYRTYRKRPSLSDYPFPRTRTMSKFYNPARPPHLVNGSSLFKRRPFSGSECRPTNRHNVMPHMAQCSNPNDNWNTDSPLRTSSSASFDCTGAGDNMVRSPPSQPSRPNFMTASPTPTPQFLTCENDHPASPSSESEGFNGESMESEESPKVPESFENGTPPSPIVICPIDSEETEDSHEQETPQNTLAENSIALQGNVTSDEVMVNQAENDMPAPNGETILSQAEALKLTTQGTVTVRDPRIKI